MAYPSHTEIANVASAVASSDRTGDVPNWLANSIVSHFQRLAQSLPLLAIAVATQVALLLLLFWLVRRQIQIADQIRQLADTARSVSRGDRQSRSTLSGGPLDEFGRIFDDMLALLGNEIRSLRGTQRELEQLVATDRLTGVGNRRLFEQQAEAESARAKRYGIPASLILFDIDHFKSINDRFGHPAGDTVLVNLARRVAHRLRDTDCIARWGGEEFAILTPCTPISGAEVLAEKVRQIVADESFEIVGRVTISLGVAQMLPGETAAHWIARADELLYEAKRSGRNRVKSANSVEERSMPFVLLWGDQFLVNHTDIDAEHAEIFRLANELILGDPSSPKSAVLSRFDQLLEQVRTHFGNEESILADLSCPELELRKHTKLHQGLVAQATELRRRLTEGSIELADVTDFIVRRIAVGHLVNSDLPLFASLANSGTVTLSDQPRPSLRLRIQRAILG